MTEQARLSRLIAGIYDAALELIEKSAGGGSYLGISRNATNGMVDEAMRRRIAMMVPHVRRALRVGHALDRRQADAAAFSDVLDHLSAGLFLLDAHGRIVH